LTNDILKYQPTNDSWIWS